MVISKLIFVLLPTAARILQRKHVFHLFLDFYTHYLIALKKKYCLVCLVKPFSIVYHPWLLLVCACGKWLSLLISPTSNFKVNQLWIHRFISSNLSLMVYTSAFLLDHVSLKVRPEILPSPQQVNQINYKISLFATAC